MPGLGNIHMSHQLNGTACWVTAAQYCLRAHGVLGTSVKGLIDDRQQFNNNGSPMDGAGDPATILKAHGVPHRAVKGEAVTVLEITTHLGSNRPVIAQLRSNVIDGWRHCVVLVGASSKGGMIAFKDPARPHPDHIVMVPSNEFVTGFVYKEEYLHQKVTAYCSALILSG